jgi:hypothetical protein
MLHHEYEVFQAARDILFGIVRLIRYSLKVGIIPMCQKKVLIPELAIITIVPLRPFFALDLL